MSSLWKSKQIVPRYGLNHGKRRCLHHVSNLYKLDRNTMAPYIKENSAFLTVIDIHSDKCLPCIQVKEVVEKWATKYQQAKFATIEYSGDDGAYLRTIGVTKVPTIQVYLNNIKINETVGLNGLREVEAFLQASTLPSQVGKNQ